MKSDSGEAKGKPSKQNETSQEQGKKAESPGCVESNKMQQPKITDFHLRVKIH